MANTYQSSTASSDEHGHSRPSTSDSGSGAGEANGGGWNSTRGGRSASWVDHGGSPVVPLGRRDGSEGSNDGDDRELHVDCGGRRVECEDGTRL